MTRALSLALVGVFVGLAWAGGGGSKAVPNVVIAIHGGAGPASPERFKDARFAAEYTDTLRQALAAGHRALQERDNPLDAVESAIRVLEDSPLYNAGKGADFTHDGRNELDSSIM